MEEDEREAIRHESSSPVMFLSSVRRRARLPSSNPLRLHGRRPSKKKRGTVRAESLQVWKGSSSGTKYTCKLADLSY